MKILFICEEYPPGKNGGIGTMVRTLGREMVRQGHSVYVLGLYPHGYGEADYEEDEGVKVWRMRYLTDFGIIGNSLSVTDQRLMQLLKLSLILQADTLLSVNRLFRRVRRLIREEGIDIIEIPDWNTFFQNSFLKIKIPRFTVPLLVKFNGSHSYFKQELNLPVKKYVYASEYDLMHRAEALASVSRYTASKTAALFHITRPIEILYNTIDLPQFSHPVAVNPRKIIFTGSLIYKKGINSLLEAWNSVAARHPDALLEVYGKGDVKKLQALLNPAAAGTVNFRGHVTREVLFGELATATAAVFPSYSECFAFAPLEAMAAGCAVINTSRSSGMELITDRENGLLVDPDDREQIANAINLLLEDHTLRNSIAAAGKKTVEANFTIQRSVPEHIAFYEQMISDSHTPNPKKT